MIPVLYPPNATDFSTFGLGVLTGTISCEVTEERNGVFECLLKYPVSGQHYGLITKECIIKAKPNDTVADQAFRIYRITKPLNGIVTIYGQHISYDLANVPVLPFSTESRSPQLILSQLLAGDTRFTGWTDYSDAKVFSVMQPKSVRACLGGTEGSMLSQWHGEFEWDNFTVKFHSHRGKKTGVVIEYGKNLTSLEQDEDNSGVYTALLPYAVYTPEGADTETVVTLPEVTLPIVTSEIVRAKTLIMDFSDQFDGVVTEDALRAKANSYIKANPLGATIPTVKVSFEPLWKQPEYSALLERVNLCDTVTIRHSLLGVSVSAMVIETVYDTLAERYKSILTNEKYKGDALLQKSFTVDFLTKKKKINEGEIPQYYVKDNHEAIIDPETFEMVQTLMTTRTKGRNRKSSVSIFSSKVKCGDCGSWYGPKVWHSNDAYRKVIWQCNHKFDGQKCATPTLTEDEIKELFLRAANQVIDQKEQFIAIYEQVLSRSLDTTALESELSDLEAEINIAAELIEECIKENAHVALDQDEYQKRYDALVARFDKAKARHTEVTDLIAERMARKHQIEAYLKNLRSREPLTEFRETDWLAMVDYIAVHSKNDIRVTFKDGNEIKA